MRTSAADNWPGHRIELLPCQVVRETLIPGQERDFHLDHLFGGKAQFSGVGDFSNSGHKKFIIEFLSKIRMTPGDPFLQQADQFTVDVIAAESGIAVRRQDAKNALVEFQNRNVKSSTAEIVNTDARTTRQPIQTVSQCGGGRFIDHSFDHESSQLRGPLGGLTLKIVEVSRNGNKSWINRISEPKFGIRFKFL